MGKLLVLGLLATLIYFFIARQVSKFQFGKPSPDRLQHENIEITVPTFLLQKLLKKVLFSVGTGLVMLLLIIVIASKFKIALLLLPISMYLIGQFFVFRNHLQCLKDQKIIYHTRNQILTVSPKNRKPYTINLSDASIKIKEIKSVQKNNGLLMGYFALSSAQNTCFIPFLAAVNPSTEILLTKLQTYKREVETKLFPII